MVFALPIALFAVSWPAVTAAAKVESDFLHIPAGVPHLPANTSSEPVEAVIARTDANEQESVVTLPTEDLVVGDPRCC